MSAAEGTDFNSNLLSKLQFGLEKSVNDKTETVEKQILKKEADRGLIKDL